MMIFNRLIVIVSILLLSGCASFYQISDKTHNKYARPGLVDDNFDITGRFFIQSNVGVQYGNFSWNKLNKHEELNFNTPLGQTVARIIIESGNASIQTGKKVYTGNDLNVLMVNNLGFSIPVEYLHYWIQGVALPNIIIENENEFGFTQLGWKVEYLEWYDPNHPKVIKISKNDIDIKLLLQWNT